MRRTVQERQARGEALRSLTQSAGWQMVAEGGQKRIEHDIEAMISAVLAGEWEHARTLAAAVMATRELLERPEVLLRGVEGQTSR